MLWALVAVLVVASLVAGCSRARGTRDDTAVAYPDGCAYDHLTMRQCDAFISRVARQNGIDLASVSKVLLLGDPGCGPDLPPEQICMRSTGFRARVQLVLADGAVIEESKFCGVGGLQDIECIDPPQLRAYAPTDGYFDVPEGASSPPTFDPGALSRAVPLSVPSLDIPIDHLGAYRVAVGKALLANGLLRKSSFSIKNDAPTDFLVDGSTVRMVAERRDGKPLKGPYASGWQAGTVEALVFVEFTVTQFNPGAVLQLRDLALE